MTKEAVASAMRASMKDSTEKLYRKLSKITAVASPALGTEWLEEVQAASLRLLSDCFIGLSFLILISYGGFTLSRLNDIIASLPCRS